MKKTIVRIFRAKLWFWLITANVLVATPAWTAIIPGLFNTGVDNLKVPLANTSPDLHYTLVAVSPLVGTPIVATSSMGFPIPPWLADNASSTWISPATNTYAPGRHGRLRHLPLSNPV